LVILEAESPDGDLSQVVQNVLRSQEIAAPTRRAALTAIAQKLPASNDPAEPADAVEVEAAEVAAAEESTQSAPRANRPRKGKTPTVLPLDMTSEVSFEDFARAKNPASDHKRFLVAAAWFKEHRQLDVITVDHVYTCYRHIKWSYNIADFSQPLRDLKHRQLMDLKAKGQYSINHLGLGEVAKLGG
jgi:hypothetical protein